MIASKRALFLRRPVEILTAFDRSVHLCVTSISTISPHPEYHKRILCRYVFGHRLPTASFECHLVPKRPGFLPFPLDVGSLAPYCRRPGTHDQRAGQFEPQSRRNRWCCTHGNAHGGSRERPYLELLATPNALPASNCKGDGDDSWGAHPR